MNTALDCFCANGDTKPHDPSTHTGAYWTREERAEWRGASAPDDHLPVFRRIAYLKIRPEEMRRMLATVDALEDRVRLLLRTVMDPGDRQNDLANVQEALNLLSALEGR